MAELLPRATRSRWVRNTLEPLSLRVALCAAIHNIWDLMSNWGQQKRNSLPGYIDEWIYFWVESNAWGISSWDSSWLGFCDAQLESSYSILKRTKPSNKAYWRWKKKIHCLLQRRVRKEGYLFTEGWQIPLSFPGRTTEIRTLSSCAHRFRQFVYIFESNYRRCYSGDYCFVRSLSNSSDEAIRVVYMGVDRWDTTKWTVTGV